MTVRAIRTFGDPVLREVCRPVGGAGCGDEGVRALVRDLLDTVDAPGHAGLAAPQIGVARRAFALNLEGVLRYVLDPVLTDCAVETAEEEEGCLSVPDLWFPTRRSVWARCEGVDLDGAPVVIEGHGLLARALQHEVDHLDGRLYLSRLAPEVRRQAMRAVREQVLGG